MQRANTIWRYACATVISDCSVCELHRQLNYRASDYKAKLRSFRGASMTPVLLPRWITQLLLLFLYCSARLRAYQFLCLIRHDTFSKYYKLLLHLHCRSRYLQCRCHAFSISFLCINVRFFIRRSLWSGCNIESAILAFLISHWRNSSLSSSSLSSSALSNGSSNIMASSLWNCEDISSSYP